MTYEDPFAGESTPALSFKDLPVGTTFTGTVLELPELLHSRDFESGELAYWPGSNGAAQGNPKMAAVVKIACNETGDDRAIWAIRPSAMFAAIKAAQEKSGQIQVGTKIRITYTGDKPNATNPRLNPAKQYVVDLLAPDPFTQDQQAAQAAQAAQPATSAAPAAANVAAVASLVARPASVPEALWVTLTPDQQVALAAVNG